MHQNSWTGAVYTALHWWGPTSSMIAVCSCRNLPLSHLSLLSDIQFASPSFCDLPTCPPIEFSILSSLCFYVELIYIIWSLLTVSLVSLSTYQGHRHNYVSGGLGSNGTQSARKFFLPYYIRNLKVYIKISILRLNISVLVHFCLCNYHNPMF